MARSTHAGWEIGRDVVRNRSTEGLRTVPVTRVATRAPAITRGQAIVVAGVALVAVGDDAGGRHLVIARERPVRGVVTPRGGCERGCRRMTVRAIGSREGRSGA